MSIAKFKNKDEYSEMNTQLQFMFDTGLHKKPNAYDAFGGLNAKSFFKFDLENDNPFKLDENFSTRSRGNKEDSYSNAFKYGFKGSVASVWELISSVPGGYDRFRDWFLEKFGVEPTTDSIADNARDYFKAIAKRYNPEMLGLDPPSTYGTKVAAGFAALPLTVAQFYPAVRGLKALGGLGKMGKAFAKRSLPGGIAATEFLRNWDDATVYEIGKATAYGYGLGKVIQIANAMQIMPRMATFAATGFFTAGWKAPLDDRFAAATVFGAAGIFGPLAEGKSVSRVATDIKLRYKQLTGEMPAWDALIEKADSAKITLEENKSLLTAHNEATNKLNDIKKAQTAGKKYKPLTEVEKSNLIKDPNEVYNLRNKVEVSEQFLEANYKALYTTKEYSMNILGADLRSPLQLKYELINPDGTAKYPDFRPGFMTKAALYLKPGKFIGQENPLFKWGVDKVNEYIHKGDHGADIILYDNAYVPNTHKNILRGQQKGESRKDYLVRTESFMDAHGLAITARRAYTTEKTYGGGITRYEVILNRSPLQAKQIADATINAEHNKNMEALSNKERFNTENKDGSYKYDITDYELSTRYRLNPEQILAFKEIQGALSSAGDHYNNAIKDFGGSNKEYNKITKAPIYFPHMFPDQFNVWVLKVKPDGTRVPIENIGVSASWEANRLKKRIENEPFIKRGNYIVNVTKVKRHPYGKLEEVDFLRSLRAFDIRGLEQEVMIIQQLLRQPSGFGKFATKRADPWVLGFKGSERYLEGKPLAKKLSPNMTQAHDFADVIRSYVRGAIGLKYKMEAKSVLKNALDEVPASDVAHSKQIKPLHQLYPNTAEALRTWSNNALGQAQPKDVLKIVDNVGARWIGESGLSNILGGLNRITLAWKLLFGNARFIAAQAMQPYHMIFPKLVDLKYQGMEEGKIALSQVKSFKDLFFPSAEIREAVKYFKQEGLIEPKFLREFTGSAGFFKVPKIEKLGTFFGNFDKIATALSLKDMSAKVEQVSRMNAGIMFYNFLKSAGHNPKNSRALSRYLADQYMVEYTHVERPLIYGDAGLGTIGKPFGLFKTFSHNYLSQLVEYINTYKHTGQSAPLVAFLAQMIFAAGLFGTIAIETADTLLEKLSPTLEKFTGKSIKGLKESILTSSFPDVIKHGIPSGMTGVDFTATLAAPGQSVTDLISLPTLDMWGLTPLPGKFWNKRAILPTLTNYLMVGAATAVTPRTALERKQAMIEFFKASAPTSMHFMIEQYYNGLPVGYKYINTEILPWIDPDAFEAYAMGPTRDPFKKSRGTFTRDGHDWLARKMGAYSIEEKEVTRLMYIATRVKTDLKNTLDNVLTTSAHHLMRDGFIPSVYFDEALKYGESPESFLKKVQNRIDLQTSDFTERVLKQTKSKGHVERLREIREIINSKYMYNR
jgi:hypothetical protein|tara:strand:+ start:857 stop:5080 length:4224 start_codon:yes stop_codon:yes gene_type:complete